MAELASHEGWLAPSRLFRRMFDAIGGETLVDRPSGRLPAAARRGRRRDRARGDPYAVTPWRDGAAWAWGLLASMLLGPVLLPWYVVWALPLVWLLPRVPRTVLLGTERGAHAVAVDLGPGRVPDGVRREHPVRALRAHAARSSGCSGGCSSTSGVGGPTARRSRSAREAEPADDRDR